MPVRDDLGTRMKSYYENISKTKLMRRTPVAIRIDGKAFHTFTRGFEKPFDTFLITAMQETTKYLCEHIQGCVLGYTQSDEITLILVDYKKLNSSAWFDYEVQKLCSIAASMATMAFNKIFADEIQAFLDEGGAFSLAQYHFNKDKVQPHLEAMKKGAMFDARCFNIPKEEVTNLIYWRQLDAARNSVQMVGQAYFSHSELQDKTCSNIQDMLMEKYQINWNDFPTHQKRGTCVVRDNQTHEWVIDVEIPQFKGENRNYIEKLVYCEEE